MRPTSESAVSLKDFAGLFFALAAIASAAVMLFNVSWKQEDADERIDHTRMFYRESQELFVSSAQANTNVRNYIMTQNPRYLALYEQSKHSLLNQSHTLIQTTRSPGVRKLLEQRLSPDLAKFIEASDRLISTAPSTANDQSLMLQQENAGAAFNRSMEALESEELKILQLRKDRILDLSNRTATMRTTILLVAFLAIVFSIFTLRTVMKKDREKIESLQAAFDRTNQAQQAALEALDEARKSNELKTQFMSNISHEIRTPMTGILGMADLLNSQDLDQVAKGEAQVLLKSAQQLLSVLNDLLNFSKLERNDLTFDGQQFALRQTIKDVINLAEGVAREKHLTLTTAVNTKVPPLVFGDEGKIRQVLSAFVSNSLKFTNDGGVQISVEPLEKDQIRIAVTDTGIGIKAEDLDKLFLPFVQIDGGIRRIHGGSGLDLAIAKHLVEIMSGQIGVLSEPGGGSIFWFTFSGASPNE
jgi:signal transduction histidine kinase